MGEGFLDRSDIKRNGLVCVVGVVLVALAFSFFGNLCKMKVAGNDSEAVTNTPLPPDVEGVMRGFRLQQKLGDASIDISGKEAALRGRKIMVFRSNLAKTTFVKEVKGAINSGKNSIIFSADSGEWDASGNSSLLLEHNVLLTVEGRKLPGVQSVRINFSRRTVEAGGDRTTVYTF